MNTTIAILIATTIVISLIVGFLLVLFFEIKQRIDEHEEFIDSLKNNQTEQNLFI